jgi:hypothetical protein
MEAFTATFSRLSDADLKDLYYDLRDQLATIAGELMRNGLANESPEQLARAKTLDLLTLQIDAVSSIVTSRRNP